MGEVSVAMLCRMNSPNRMCSGVGDPFPPAAARFFIRLTSADVHMCDITWHMPSSTTGFITGNSPEGNVRIGKKPREGLGGYEMSPRNSTSVRRS